MNKRERRVFTEEFKHEAVRLIETSGRTITQIADELGVGWQTSDRLTRDLAITALKRAIATRQPLPGLIHHSDRGSQYCSHEYRKLLIASGMYSSMSGKGNC